MSEKKTVLLLYMGAIPTIDKSLAHQWYRIEAVENDGRHLEVDDERIEVYSKKKKRAPLNNLVASVQAGSIYRFDRGETDNTVVSDSGRYVERWQNDDDVVRWSANHHATIQAFNAKKDEKKNNKIRADLEILEPIRNAYWNARNSRERELILANVIRAITSHNKLAKNDSDD